MMTVSLILGLLIEILATHAYIYIITLYVFLVPCSQVIRAF